MGATPVVPPSFIPWIVAALAAAVAIFALAGWARHAVRRRGAERLAGNVGRQLRAITGAMRESAVVYDRDLKLQFVNSAFETLTGYSAEELRERNFIDYVHPEDRPGVTAEWEKVVAGGRIVDQEYRIVTRDGQVKWCCGSWEPTRDEFGAAIGYLGTELDITARKHADEEIRRDGELFQGVIDVQQAIATAALDSDAVMRVIAERSQALTGAVAALVEVVVGDELVPRVHLGVSPPRVKIADSISGLCVRTGELQRSDDAITDRRVDRRAYMPLGVRSLLAVPLVHDREVIGVLTVLSTEPRAFSERSARALRLLAGIMGAALSHASAFEGRQARLEERTRALQESEQRFKQLVDAAQEGIWVLDERGITTYVNQRMADLLGYAHGDMLGRPVYDFIDAAERSQAQTYFDAQAAGGAVHDLRFRRRNGTELWSIVARSPILGRDGAFVGTVAMVTDITERKRVETRLRRSAERMQMLHEVDQAILAARSPSEIGQAALLRVRRMVPCQRSTIVLYDFARGEAQIVAGYAGNLALASVPRPLSDFSPAATLRSGVVRSVENLPALESLPPILAQLADEGIRSVLSVPLLVEGEVIGELNLSSTAIAGFEPEQRDIAMEVAAPLAIAIQQTRLREELHRQAADLERRIVERTAELRSTNAELEVFSHSVSHDLRAPLRRIVGFARTLLEEHGSGLNDSARHYADGIHDGARQLAVLVDDLITISRIGRQDLMRRPSDLNLLVSDTLEELGDELEGRQIDWRIEQLPTVECDPSLMRMALRHLLSNAIKFTRPRPEALIRLSPVALPGEAGVAVEDNGVGFEMADANKVFGVFRRLHDSEEFEGNGVGLAIVQRIALRHGGSAWAEAQAGRGATFYCTVRHRPDE